MHNFSDFHNYFKDNITIFDLHIVFLSLHLKPLYFFPYIRFMSQDLLAESFSLI